MSINRKNPHTDLDEAISAIRQDTPDSTGIRAAAERVREQLEGAAPGGITGIEGNQPIRTCAAFRALIPGYRAGSLSPARRSLLEDHVHECVDCRKNLWQAVSPESRPAGSAVRRGSGRSWRWAAVAATILLAALVFQLGLLNTLFVSGDHVRAVAERVDGKLFRVNASGIASLPAGQEITAGQLVRTGRSARAMLRMTDGTRIEMSERAELSLQARSDGACIDLRQGSIIVQAARQAEKRHLYVDTSDCLVSVKGTIFSVTRGTKGSRVSVLQGEVWVDQAGRTRKVFPGQQVSTSPNSTPRPIAREVAWSAQSAEYESLLRGAVAEAGRDLLQAATTVPLRYDSELLSLVPENTSVYVAIPNVSAAVADAGVKIGDLIRQNPELRAWYEQNHVSGPDSADLDEVAGRLRELGARLGDELVIAVWKTDSRSTGFILLAKAVDPAGLKAALESDLARHSGSTRELPVVLVEDARRIPVLDRDSLGILLTGGYLAASTDADELRRFSDALASGDRSFSRTAFHSQVAAAYQDGVAWLVAADLQGLPDEAEAGAPNQDPENDLLGLNDLRYLVIEQKSVREQPQLRAALSFAAARRGIPSWLSEPGPMGTLEFVSPSAGAAVCFLVKKPLVILDELMAILRDTDSQALDSLLEFQTQHGLDVRNDLAAPLGGEVLVALDGPLLPVPAWKLVLLLDDPARFQQTLDKLLADANRELAAAGKPVIRLSSETEGGITCFDLAGGPAGTEAHYTYWEGYFLMAPSRSLLTEAIRNRASGYTLPRSEAFQAALPVDGQEQFSAVIYQNLQQVAGPVAALIPASQAGDGQADLNQAKEMLQNIKPMLLAAYAGQDRIVVTWAGPKGFNPFDLSGLASFSNFMKVHKESR